MNNDSIYSTFKTIDEGDFLNFIKNMDGKPVLLVAKRLLNFLKAILTQKCIDATSICLLESSKHDETTRSIIAVSNDDPEMFEKILETFQHYPKAKKHILVAPRYSPSCLAVYDNSPYKAGVQVFEYHAEIIDLDKNRFIIPVPLAFSNCYCDSDISDIYTIARALLKLEMINGVPKRVFTAGPMSGRIRTLMDELQGLIGSTYFRSDNPSHYDDLFIIDRTVDLLTPMVHQWSMGGRLDEIYNPEYNYLDLPSGITFNGITSKKIADRYDTVYEKIEGLRLPSAFLKLTEYTKESTEIVQELKDLKGTNQWRQKKKRADELVKEKPYIEMYAPLADAMVDSFTRVSKRSTVYNTDLDFIDMASVDLDIITDLARRGRLFEAIKLLAVCSQTNRGAPADVVDLVGNLCVAKLGPHFAREWIRLLSCGLVEKRRGLFASDPRPPFEQLRKAFSLVERAPQTEGEGEPAPLPLEQYYEGYVPLLLRIVEAGLRDGWSEKSPQGKLLRQLGIPLDVRGEQAPPRKVGDEKPYRTALVFVVGGVTQNELAMFSKLGEVAFNDEYRFHIGSTSVTSPRRMLLEVCPMLGKSRF